MVTDKFAPHAGGTSVLWTEWCRRWPPEAVRVVTRQFLGWQEFDKGQLYSISRVPYVNIPKARMPITWLLLFAQTVRECRRRPDVLQCGQILETACYAPWLKKRYGVRFVVHTYGEELSAYARNPRLCRLMQRTLAAADAVTAISDNTAGILRSSLGVSGHIDVIHPGVNTARFVPGDGGHVRSRFKLTAGPLLLTASRLMRRKGHDKVFEALPAIVRRFPSLQYVIAGGGPDESRLRRLVANNGLASSVTFLGKVTDEDMVLLMQAADIFIHPNRELENGDVEGFGIVFLEANACATPVIGGNSGGTPEAIQDGVTGFLVDPNSPVEIADRVITLLEDNALRNRMGLAGRRWAEGFTWEASADKVWQLTERVAHC